MKQIAPFTQRGCQHCVTQSHWMCSTYLLCIRAIGLMEFQKWKQIKKTEPEKKIEIEKMPLFMLELSKQTKKNKRKREGK